MSRRSPQVLQEFLVNAIRKLQRPIALAQARDIVRAYGTWVVRDAGVGDILRRTELMELTGYSFWDSHILASAEASGAECLYSEVMQHGYKVVGLEIRNPFAESGPADEKRHIDAVEGHGSWTGRGCCDFRSIR